MRDLVSGLQILGFIAGFLALVLVFLAGVRWVLQENASDECYRQHTLTPFCQEILTIYKKELNK